MQAMFKRLKNLTDFRRLNDLLFAKAHKVMEDKKSKNKGGRPKVEGREKSKFEVKCYLKFDEIIAFDNYKKTHGLKKSEIVRKAVLKELKIAQKKTPKLTPEILNLFYEIERTNHSLNQVAKLLNTGLQLNGSQTIEFLKTIALLKQNSTEIKNKLSQNG